MILTDIFKVMKKIIILFLLISLFIFSVYTEEDKFSVNNNIILQSTITNSTVAQREQALPLLDLKNSIKTGKLLLDLPLEIPVKYNLSSTSKQIVSEILKNIHIQSLPELKPVILTEDLEISQDSEEYQLKRILESDFKDQNWTKAYNLITNFLRVDHSEKIKTKAHFYRAQVLFFQDKYRESFMEFTLAGDNSVIKTKQWIDTLLNYLHKMNM